MLQKLFFFLHSLSLHSVSNIHKMVTNKKYEVMTRDHTFLEHEVNTI